MIDVGSLQVRSNPEKDFEGEARDVTTVRAEAVKNANKVLGEAVEEIQHEDHECYLYKGRGNILEVSKLINIVLPGPPQTE